MKSIKRKFMAIWGAALAFAVLAGAAPLKAEVLVQVMSVEEEAAARKEADRLFNLGVPAFSRAEEAAGLGLRNRVFVGPFETEAEAAAAASALKKSGAIKDFVLKTAPSETAPSETAAAPTAASTSSAAPSIPALDASAGESIAGLPAAPSSLPVAETPTYGEPVRPEQARDLGLTEPRGLPAEAVAAGPAEVTNLPTYGQAETQRPGRAEVAAPPDLKPGDDMPGLVVAPGQLPPPPPVPVSRGAVAAPSAGDEPEPYGRSRAASFDFVVDLSSSMRRMSSCRGLIKEEAVTHLIRKMNRRIPAQPYQGALRVFGYKRAMTRADFTTLYYGPGAYSREGFEAAIARLAAADSISPFSDALRAADGDLQSMPAPKLALMFSDFQESVGSGNSLMDVENARRRHGPALTVHTFYVSRQRDGEKLAKSLAKAGGGQAWEICSLLDNDAAFERMMTTVFGPGGATACQDADGDGVCDEYDLCPNTPAGAPVDTRGCWIAAYSQFFDFNKAEVKSEFRPRLVEAARIMKSDPNTPRIIIAGYTDNVGSQDYNLNLGRRRAQAVADILIAEGVPAGRLSVVSRGKENPAADNATEEGRARNRRVEFHIGEEPKTAPGRAF